MNTHPFPSDVIVRHLGTLCAQPKILVCGVRFFGTLRPGEQALRLVD